MNYLSVCSGIEAASCAWHPLGWRPVAFSEIEPFPSAVLAHHYPTTPNLGDMTKFQEWPDAVVDVLVGGTPCQSFSVAGLRKGLADPRGNLMLTFGGIAAKYRPEWLVWENVPGVLSSNGGRDFGTFLGMLGELGYGFAYRILDAQFFGVAQRRRRVFVVANARSWRRAAAVLFERHSLSGHPAPRREAGQGTANALVDRPERGGGNSEGQRLIPQLARCVTTGEAKRQDYETCTIIPAISFGWQNSSRQGASASEHCTPTLDKSKTPAIGFVPKAPPNSRSMGEREEQSPTVTTHQNGQGALHGMAVRRLTPEECEALQGFPRGYTDIRQRGKDTPDGPRYKALGNSMAVPCMAWLGRRIAAVANIRRAVAA